MNKEQYKEYVRQRLVEMSGHLSGGKETGEEMDALLANHPQKDFATHITNVTGINVHPLKIAQTMEGVDTKDTMTLGSHVTELLGSDSISPHLDHQFDRMSEYGEAYHIPSFLDRETGEYAPKYGKKDMGYAKEDARANFNVDYSNHIIGEWKQHLKDPTYKVQTEFYGVDRDQEPDFGDYHPSDDYPGGDRFREPEGGRPDGGRSYREEY